MGETYFFAMVVGVPLLLLALALLAGYFHRGGYQDLLDWKPTRSAEREAKLEVGDIQQMLAAGNSYRRRRGAPERSLDEVTEQAWAGLSVHREVLRPRERG